MVLKASSVLGSLAGSKSKKKGLLLELSGK